MLDAVFRGHGLFIVMAILIMIAVWVAALRYSSHSGYRAVTSATWAASIAGVLTLTLWSTGESRGPAECFIDADLRDSFGTEQGLLNLAMFIPVGVLGVLATRRFLPAAVVGLALSSTVETLQGAFPFLGRACDTGDLITNSCGALVGAAVGWVLVKVDTRDPDPWHFRRRPALIGITVFAACLGIVWGTGITPRFITTGTPIRTASAAQKQALRTELRRAFGDQYTPELITFVPTGPGTGNLSASIGPASSMQISWPDATSAEYSLEIAAQGEDHGYRVPGALHRAATPAQAIAVATAYAHDHTPWALKGVHPTATTVPHIGWMISWRRRVDNVLMPMRLDIEIDHAGRIEQLLSRHLPDVSVPSPTLTARQAAVRIRQAAPQCDGAVPGELLALRHEGRWIAAWRVAVACGDREGIITVDARSGTTLSKSLYPRPTAAPSLR
ncbi:VanZ family protein [Streptomyces sp. NPDC046985]|uniref:VanZ family protein n=1 Tax=Streptomyces sp. NPDC046985 TaxID=3155377 RepID=UPI0033CF50D9